MDEHKKNIINVYRMETLTLLPTPKLNKYRYNKLLTILHQFYWK